MKPKTLVIYNPKSGRSARTARLLPLLRDFVRGSGGRASLAVTEGAGHATELARGAVESGCDRVIAVGGDGTLNETAQPLVGTGTALGLVPCGSGNGLARHLRLPGSALASLHLASNGHARVATIDTGVADGKPFFNVMGLGLDADVSRRFNRLVRRGLPAYAATAWKAYRESVPEICVIGDGTRLETVPVLILAVANSDQYGNDARIAPHADVNDGLLDLVVIPPTGLLAAPGLIYRLFRGTLDRAPGVRHWRAARFRIERPAAGLIHTDGETHAAGRFIEVEVRPASLRVLLPP